MKITRFQNPNLVHAVTLFADDNEDTKIHRFWHLDRGVKDTIGDDEILDHEGIVYFITVNDEIVKMGGSTDNIKGLVGQYVMNLNAKGDPMFTRFPIYLMMLDLLCDGHRIDYYFIPVEPYWITINDLLTGKPRKVLADDFHGFEAAYIQHVIDLCGTVPLWNVAEGSSSFPEYLRRLWEDRRGRLQSTDDIFDYDAFLNRDYDPRHCIK